jgi:hypothetical protein
MLKKRVEAIHGLITDAEYQNALMLTTDNVRTWVQYGAHTYLHNIVEAVGYHIIEMRR